MNIKKILIGDPMPDKNDPKYKERYEREVDAGRKFADKVGISWLARHLQEWGNSHKVAFLVISFGIVIGFFAYNVYHLIQHYNYDQQHPGHRPTAVERQDSVLQEILKNH